MIAGVVAAFVVQANTIALVVTLIILGLGLVYYKSKLFDATIGKIKGL